MRHRQCLGSRNRIILAQRLFDSFTIKVSHELFILHASKICFVLAGLFGPKDRTGPIAGTMGHFHQQETCSICKIILIGCVIQQVDENILSPIQ